MAESGASQGTAAQLARMIGERFEAQGFAQGAQNKFTFVKRTEKGFIVGRERGEDTPISFTEIVAVIEIARQDIEVYREGPTKLKAYIQRRVQSPLWALLHLLSEEELLQ